MKGVLARIGLSIIYGSATLVAKLLRFVVPRRPPASGRLLAIGTFHNPNWFTAHIGPLAASGVKEVIVVADGYVRDMPRVRMAIPKPIVAKLLTRSVAKLIWAFGCAVRYRPDMYMGYAIFPAATWALLLARLFGKSCCFQLTSGKLELEGGGNRAENRLLSSLDTPSASIEKLAFALTRQFDLMVVRGSKAETYVRDLGYRGRIATITGSVRIPDYVRSYGERDIDLVYVARLTRRKRPDRFVEVVQRVAREVPGLTAKIVGDGTEYENLARQIADCGLTDNVELTGLRHDVPELVGRSRVFVLTSRWEGLSIALLEAMAGGVVPVASDVGDLADVVRNGETGYLFDEEDLDSFARAIVKLIRETETWSRISAAARAIVSEKSGVGSVTKQWRTTLGSYIALESDPGAELRQ